MLVFSVPGPDGRVLTTVDAAQSDYSLRFTDVLPGTVEALVYPAGEYELGVLALAPEEEIGRPLTTPARTYRLRFDEAAVWETTAAPSDETASLRTKVCERVTRTEARWEVEGFVRFAIAIDDEVALFGSSNGSFASTFVSDGVTVTEIPGRLTGSSAPRSAWRGAGDDVWFGDFLGRVSKGRATREGIVDPEIVFRFDFGDDVDSMDGHIDEQGNVEIFASSSTGAVAHFDGSAWTRATGQLPGVDGHAIIWRAPGEATLAALESREVARVSNGQVRPDEAPPGEVRSARFVPALGEVLGVQSGELYVRNGDAGWAQLTPPLALPILAMEPSEVGIDYLLASGRVGRYHHPLGLCPNEAILPTLGFEAAAVRLGDNFFVAGELNAAAARTQGTPGFVFAVRLSLDPAGRHWLDVDFAAGAATLGHDLGDRRSRLFEALVRELVVGDEGVDAATNRVSLPAGPCDVRVGGTVARIDPVERRAEMVRRLTPYEARFLAETGVAHPRTADAIDVVLRTDLHTHYAGCLSAERLVAIGREAGVSYTRALLEQVGVRTSKPELRVDELGDGALGALIEGLSVPLDRQVPFREMQSIYRRRAPITKHLPLFETQLLAIAEDYAAMGVRYAELSLFDVVNASWWRIAQDCLPRIEADTGVTLRFLVAFHRTDDLEWDLDMLARIDTNRASRVVVGVDFMGHETNPTADFGPQLTAVAKWANEKRPGFVVRVHAGENPAFPENVRDALRFTDGCDVQLRIGHGLYGVDDATLDELAKRRVAVEFNLDSNYALNNLRRCPEAPIERYARAGVPIVIGTDGYGLYQTTLPLALETARLAGLSDAHARRVAAYEETLLERRRELDESLEVSVDLPDDPPLVHFTSEVAAAKAATLASDASRFESALATAGVPTVDGLDDWLGGRRAVSIAGAWKHSWTRLDADERRAIESALEAMVGSLDPNQHAIVTGGTKYGVEGVLHRLEPSVPVLGAVVSSVPPDAIADRGVGAFYVAGAVVLRQGARALRSGVANRRGRALLRWWPGRERRDPDRRQSPHPSTVLRRRERRSPRARGTRSGARVRRGR